jgi:hypothetical protein
MGALIVISGLPGVGKVGGRCCGRRSAWCSPPVDRTPLRRHCLVRVSPRVGDGVAAYEAARVVAEQQLALGRTVVVDAVNDSEAARDTWRTGSARTDPRLVFALLTLDDLTEHRHRLEARVRNLTNVAGPRWNEVLERGDVRAVG